MSTKPSTIMNWASGGSAAVVTPPSGKRDYGFIKGEEPPAEFLNALLKNAGEWHQYLSDGAMTGAFTFADLVTMEQLTLTHASASDVNHLLRAKSPLGHVRSAIDRYGYRGGHIVEWCEYWNHTDGGPSGALANGYWNQSGTGEYNVDTPNANYPARNVALKADNTQSSVLSGPDIAYFTQDQVFEMEWDALVSAEVGGKAAQYTAGIYSDVVGSPLAYFYGDTDVDATWHCWNGATDTDSNIAIPLTNGGRARMKIAIVGDNNHSGSNELIHFYIDGALVVTMTPTVADAKLSPYFKVQNPDIGSLMYLNIGIVKANWNLSLNPT